MFNDYFTNVKHLLNMYTLTVQLLQEDCVPVLRLYLFLRKSCLYITMHFININKI